MSSNDWMDPHKNATGRPGTSLPGSVINSIQTGSMRFSYRGVPTYKNPFDLAIYSLLLWEQRPRTIIEIGSQEGGGANWLADTMLSYGFPAHVYSIDDRLVNRQIDNVTFLAANPLSLERDLPPDFMSSLPRPIMVIEDASHEYVASLAVLDFFHPWLKSGEYIVTACGIITDMAGPDTNSGGPRRAIEEWLAKHPGKYDVDPHYCDWYGENVTWNVNGFIRKK